MKKISLLLVTASIALITMPSCKKQEQPPQPITQTVDATIKVNETYSYVLPASDGPEPYTIIKQSEHASRGTIEKNAAGNFVFNYTPTANFTGTDVIVLSDGKEGHGPCNQPGCDHQEHHNNKLFHHGNCQHHEKQKHIVTINFTINGAAATVVEPEMIDK